MATLTEPVPVALERSERRIAEPLRQLQRLIRTYVATEELLRALTFVCIWFWATFLLDFGMFRLFGLDYLREGSPGFIVLLRVMFLGTLAAGLVWILGFGLLRRLAATFSPAGLALVFERRFPGVLGDRLVTAVELADRAKAAEYGFSEAMLAETVNAAAERIDRVAIADTFNWRRLAVRGGIALLLLLSVGTVAVVATEKVARWGERNLLLQHSYWPRDVLLEVPDFVDSNVKAVSQGGDYRLVLRGLQWVVRTRENDEGWRALEWRDLPTETPTNAQPWELPPHLLPAPYAAMLPAEWRQMRLDDAQIKALAIGREPDAPASRAALRALGQSAVDHLRGVLADKQAARLSEAHLLLLPEDIRTQSHDVIDAQLAISQHVDLARFQLLSQALQSDRWQATDGAQALGGAVTLVKPPFLPATVLQRLSEDAPASVASLALTEADWQGFPAAWKQLPLKKLLPQLEEFAAEEALERYGERLRQQLLTLFGELDSRADPVVYAKRPSFRRLDVPMQVTVEFEQVLTEEERARGKPRIGKPLVRRQLGTNDFTYDFRRIDRPLQFRIVAGNTVTPWYRLDVKPLPVLKQLTRTQVELGYLHGSNESVVVGPFNVSLEGDESTLDVATGTALTLGGQFTKPIKTLRVTRIDKDEPHPAVAALSHASGTDAFTLRLRDVVNEEQRFQLVFEDLDGIVGTRRFHLRVAADREPVFKRSQYVLVNKKMITPAAVIPFSGHVQDDFGLTGLAYDVAIEELDRKPIKRATIAFRRFQPLQLAQPAPDGLVFEKRGQVAAARLFAGPGFEAFTLPPVLANLPMVGLRAWAVVPPVLEAPREYVFDYRPRAVSDGVLGPDDEFLDTLALRPAPEAGRPMTEAALVAEIPYRLVVRLLATDNRLQPQGDGTLAAARQTARSPESFEFQVVSEEDLLIEMGKREEDLRDQCDRVIEAIGEGRRSILKRLQGDFAAKFQGESAYDFRRAANDAGDMVRVLRDNRDLLDRNAAQPFRDVYRELVLNRANPTIIERIDKKICRPLEVVLLPGQHFSRAEEAAEALGRALESEKGQADPLLLDRSLERTDQLLARLEEIVNEMRKLLEFKEALKVLQDLIKDQDRVNKAVEKKQKDTKKSELDD